MRKRSEKPFEPSGRTVSTTPIAESSSELKSLIVDRPGVTVRGLVDREEAGARDRRTVDRETDRARPRWRGSHVERAEQARRRSALDDDIDAEPGDRRGHRSERDRCSDPGTEADTIATASSTSRTSSIRAGPI